MQLLLPRKTFIVMKVCISSQFRFPMVKYPVHNNRKVITGNYVGVLFTNLQNHYLAQFTSYMDELIVMVETISIFGWHEKRDRPF